MVHPAKRKANKKKESAKKNHANYINGMGYYDVVKYIGDHSLDFLSLNSVFVGEIAPHLSTEVDCKSIFSMAGYKSHPSRAQGLISATMSA